MSEVWKEYVKVQNFTQLLASNKVTELFKTESIKSLDDMEKRIKQ